MWRVERGDGNRDIAIGVEVMRGSLNGGMEAHVAIVCQPPNKALQTDKTKLSCLFDSQKSRQLAFVAELAR
jgi:hypothetical protein